MTKNGWLRRTLALLMTLTLILSTMPVSYAQAEGTEAAPAVSEQPAPSEETPSEGAPSEETPAAEKPSEETPSEEAPSEQTPSEEAPSEQTPSEETPSEEAPSEEAPSEEAPSEETPVAETAVYFIYNPEFYAKSVEDLAKLVADRQDGVKLAKAKVGDKLNKIADPALAGYTFDGWYKDKNCTKKWDFSQDTLTEATLRLFAKWNENVPVEPELPTDGGEQPTEEVSEQPSEGAPEQPTEEVSEQPSEGAPEQPSEGAPEQPTEEVSEQPTEEVSEQPSEGAPEQPTEEVSEQPSELPTDASEAESTGETGSEVGTNQLPTMIAIAMDGQKVTTTVRLPLGSMIPMDVIFYPAESNAEITWQSSYPRYATVDEFGYVSSVAVGTTRITARTSNGKASTITVTVFDPTIPTGIKLTPVPEQEPGMGENYVAVDIPVLLNYTLLPEGTAESEVLWRTSSSTYATVDETGIVTPKRAGTVTITATTKKAGRSASVRLTIYDPTVPANVVLADEGTRKVAVGDECDLSYAVHPATADQDVTWVSSGTRYATVSETGHVTALREGTATITVRTKKGGKTDTVKILVYDPYKPLSVKISPEGSVKLALQDTLPLAATIDPETAIKDVTWSSSNTRIATVDASGVVTPQTEGTVTIRVRTDYIGKTDSIRVTVYDPHKPTSIVLSETGTRKVEIHDTVDVSLIQYPVETADSEIIWKSSNSSIASIEEGDGRRDGAHITLHKKGTVTITATAKSGGRRDYFRLSITDPYEPTGIKLEQSGTVSMSMGATLQIAYALLPSYAESPVTFSSSNTRYATVDENGLVTGVAEGTVTITATATKNNRRASFRLEVLDPTKPTAVVLDTTGTVALDLNSQLDLNATVQPVETAVSDVTWRSSNTSIVKITQNDANGYNVTLSSGDREGTVTITATTVKQRKMATLKITVADTKKPTKIELDKSGTVAVETKTTLPVTYVLYPEGTAEDVIIWTSSNSKVASVDASGVVTPQSKGIARITARTTKNGLTDYFYVSVTDPYEPTAIKLEPSSTTDLDLKQTLTISYTLEPEGTAYSEIQWTSSNPLVAKVDEKGVVTPLREGNARITARTLSGNRTDFLTVNVVDATKPTGIVLDRTGKVAMDVNGVLDVNATLLPVDTAESEITWRSSNSAIVTVEADAMDSKMAIVASNTREGTATITATTVNQRKIASFTVVVADKTKPTKITLGYSGTVPAETRTTFQVEYTLYPEGTAEDIVKWSTSNANVAKVDENGFVTPVGKGSARITATTSKNYLSAYFYVSVTDPYEPTGITLEPSGSADVDIHATLQINYQLQPVDTAFSEVQWSSSNPLVATINETGLLTPIKEGSVRVIAKTTSGGRIAYLYVNVIDSTKPSGVSLNYSTMQTVYVDETMTLTDNFPIIATVYPSTADKQINWISSNKNIAEVEVQEGAEGDQTVVKLIPKQTGMVTITAETVKEKKRASFTIQIKDKTYPTSMTLSATGTKTLNLSQDPSIPGTSEQLRVIANVTPIAEAVTDIQWTSSNPEVAMVTAIPEEELDKDGGEYFGAIVVPYKVGYAIITAKTARGAKTASFRVSVNDPYKATSVSIFPNTTQYLDKEEKFEITYSMLPVGANSTHTWTSTNPLIADVQHDDVENKDYVVGKSQGTAVITCLAASGVRASVTVIVSGTTLGDDNGTNWSYTNNGSEVTISKYKGSASVVEIPMTINGVPVTAIDGFDNRSVSSVIFGENVVSIGDKAFIGCTSLSSVVLNKGLNSIGSRAFYGTAITSLNLPSTVSNVTGASFYGMNSLSNITVSENNNAYCTRDGVLMTADETEIVLFPAAKSAASYTTRAGASTLQPYSFSNVRLTNITISADVSHLDGAFNNCSNLVSVSVSSGNSSFSSEDGVLFDGSKLILYPTAKTANFYNMPGSTTAVAENAFLNNTHLSTLYIGQNVTVLPDNAINGCDSLTTLSIPVGVTENIETIMSKCPALSTISVANSNSAYSSDSGVLLNGAGTTILKCPRSKSTAYNAKNGVSAVAESAFKGCSKLPSVTLPEGLSTIGDSAFANCTSLTSVTLPQSIQQNDIAGTAFTGHAAGLTIRCYLYSGAFYFARTHGISYTQIN